MFISIVIPSRNRAASLARTLEGIGKLSRPMGLPWELVVVDNNSTDNTKAIVESFRQSSGLDVRYVFEARTGVSQARNIGIGAARGEIIAFIDDDIIVDQEWLCNIARECSRNSSVSMYFGQTKLFRSDQARLSIREGDLEETYIFPCNPCYAGSSNNMILRRAALSSTGGFDTSFGPGTALSAAEDIDLIYRVLRSGGIVHYCPNILVYHDHDRLSPAAIRSVLFAYAKGKGGFYTKHIVRRDIWAAKLCYWEVQGLLSLALKKDRLRSAFRQISGLAAGVLIRLGVETKQLVFGAARGEVRTEPAHHLAVQRSGSKSSEHEVQSTSTRC